MEELDQEIVVLDESYAKITYHEPLLLIFIDWQGKATTQEYQNAFNVALDYSNSKKIELFLSDISKRKITGPNDRQWFEEVALPKAVEKGLKKGAVIFDGNPFKKYYLNTICMRTKMYMLPFKFFTSKEKAIEWLKS